MTTWKQELAAEVTAIDEVNAITVKMKWHVKTDSDRYSAKAAETDTVYESELKVKSPRGINANLIDGLNYLAGDMVIECGYLLYEEAFTAQEGLTEARDIAVNYGILEGTDGIELNGLELKIVRVEGLGLLTDEESGASAAAKLRMVLRK